MRIAYHLPITYETFRGLPFWEREAMRVELNDLLLEENDAQRAAMASSQQS